MVHKTLPPKENAITALLNIYDELDALTRKNEELRRKVDAYARPVAHEACESLPEDKFLPEFAKVGMLRVYERATCSYLTVSRYGDGSYETFEQFRDRYIEKIPDYMSRREFCEIYAGRLADDYEERLAQRKQREGDNG